MNARGVTNPVNSGRVAKHVRSIMQFTEPLHPLRYRNFYGKTLTCRYFPESN